MASRQARQFEFHPTLPNVLLVGETSGGVTVTRTDEFVDEAYIYIYICIYIYMYT